MEFDITTLIQEIKVRKPLWQRDNYSRSCRDVINKLWTEVATKMGVPKELVKTKWKGLRDNFRSELRKIPNKKDHTHRSKWIYFNDMMFIKDQMTTRSNVDSIVTGDVENVNIDVDVYMMDDGVNIERVREIKDSESVYEFFNVGDFVATSSTNSSNIQSNKNDNLYDLGYGNPFVSQSNNLISSKQTFEQCSLNGKTFLTNSVLDSKNSKPRKLDSCVKKSYRSDDDFYFLMSFLPMIKSLPPDKRMYLRFKIQCLVFSEVYKNTKRKV